MEEAAVALRSTTKQRIGAAVIALIAAFFLLGSLATKLWLPAVILAVAIFAIIPGPTARTLRDQNVTVRVRLIVAMVLTAIGFVLVLVQTPTPDEKAKIEATDAAATTKAASDAEAAQKAEQLAKATASHAPFVKQYREMLAVAAPCDQAIGEVGKAATAVGSGGSMVDLYSAANDGEAACQKAWLAINGMSPPDDMPEDAETLTKEAIETCGSAYYLRQRAMETAKTIADGDAKPSNVLSFRNDAQQGQAGVLACVAKWFEAGGKLGVKPEQLK